MLPWFCLPFHPNDDRFSHTGSFPKKRVRTAGLEQSGVGGAWWPMVEQTSNISTVISTAKTMQAANHEYRQTVPRSIIVVHIAATTASNPADSAGRAGDDGNGWLGGLRRMSFWLRVSIDTVFYKNELLRTSVHV
jgi:hypothetical protein